MAQKRILLLDSDDLLQGIGHAKKQKLEYADLQQKPEQKLMHTEALRISEQVYADNLSVGREIIEIVQQLTLDVECQHKHELFAAYTRDKNVMKMQSATYNPASDKICFGHFARKADDSKIFFPSCLRLVLKNEHGILESE